MTWLPTEPLKSQECKWAEKLAKVEKERDVYREALENIRYSGLSQGWCGDKTTQGDYKEYAITVAGEALAATAEKE